MQKARMLGNYIEQLADEKNLSLSDLSATLNCQENQVKSLLKGRSFATFDQISLLSKQLGVTVSELLHGNEEHYNATVVHCMNQFQNVENRELILDIIDDYMDIYDAVNQHQ